MDERRLIVSARRQPARDAMRPSVMPHLSCRVQYPVF